MKTKKPLKDESEEFKGITGHVEGPQSIVTAPWDDEERDQFSLYRLPAVKKMLLEKE